MTEIPKSTTKAGTANPIVKLPDSQASEKVQIALGGRMNCTESFGLKTL